MIATDKINRDISGNPINIGDVIAFVRRGVISFGRVMWFTAHGITVNEASKVRKYNTSESVDPVTGRFPSADCWELNIKNFGSWHGALIITMHSLPKEVFELFDNIDIKEIPKVPKKKVHQVGCYALQYPEGRNGVCSCITAGKPPDFTSSES